MIRSNRFAFYIKYAFQQLYFILIPAITELIKEPLKSTVGCVTHCRLEKATAGLENGGESSQSVAIKNKRRECKPFNPINQSHRKRKKGQRIGRTT